EAIPCEFRDDPADGGSFLLCQIFGRLEHIVLDIDRGAHAREFTASRRHVHLADSTTYGEGVIDFTTPMKLRGLFCSVVVFSQVVAFAAEPAVPVGTHGESGEEFQVVADRFADLQVLRYRVPGFEELPLQQKKLAYY